MEISNKRLLLIIGAVVAVALICVLVVGMINGTWPWSNDDLGKDYTGMTTTGDTTGDTGTEGTEDPTGTVDATEENAGTGTGTGTGNGTGTGTGNTQNPGPSVGVETEATGDTEATEPNGNNSIDFDDLLEGLNGNG